MVVRVQEATWIQTVPGALPAELKLGHGERWGGGTLGRPVTETPRKRLRLLFSVDLATLTLPFETCYVRLVNTDRTKNLKS